MTVAEITSRRRCQGCGRTDVIAQRRCNACYIQYRKSEAFTPVPRPTVAERIAVLLAADENGCLVWQGTRNNKGYGQITLWDGEKRRVASVHRVEYERVRGPIPEGLVLDHLCRNRACANVDHLEVVTQQVNMARAADFMRPTHCKSGRHLLAQTAVPNGRSRRCSVCLAEYEKARSGRRSAARAARRAGGAA